ncbi:MAG: carbon storage regulator [Isosphaeraceae bacterium]
MLVLSRKISQQVLIGSDISITIVRIDRNQVRIGISAPPGVSILRQELVDKRPDAGRRPADQSQRVEAKLV